MADDEKNPPVAGVARTRTIRDPKYGHMVEVHELRTAAPAPAPVAASRVGASGGSATEKR
jgi:hypothetical protein